MTHEIEFGPVYETAANARRTQALSLQDLIAAHHPNPRSEANPEDKGLVKLQRDRLARHPEQYAGAYLDDELVAFIKFCDWPASYELDFLEGLEKGKLLARRLHPGHWFVPGNPLGIMGLVADEKLRGMLSDEEVMIILETLVDESITFANQDEIYREIKIPHYHGDPARRATEAKGFKWTGKTAELFGIQQDLLVRPAGPTALEAFSSDNPS